MYARLTFIFNDYESFLIFCATIPTTHFQLIRSVRIVQSMTSEDCQNLNMHFPREASYRLLGQKGILVRNADLPKIGSIDSWQHTCQILLEMRNLRSFRLDISDYPENVHKYLGGSETFWEDLKIFLESRKLDQGLVVRLDRVTSKSPVLPQLQAMGIITPRRVLFP